MGGLRESNVDLVRPAKPGDRNYLTDCSDWRELLQDDPNTVQPSKSTIPYLYNSTTTPLAYEGASGTRKLVMKLQRPVTLQVGQFGTWLFPNDNRSANMSATQLIYAGTAPNTWLVYLRLRPIIAAFDSSLLTYSNHLSQLSLGTALVFNNITFGNGMISNGAVPNGANLWTRAVEFAMFNILTPLTFYGAVLDCSFGMDSTFLRVVSSHVITVNFFTGTAPNQLKPAFLLGR